MLTWGTPRVAASTGAAHPPTGNPDGRRTPGRKVGGVLPRIGRWQAAVVLLVVGLASASCAPPPPHVIRSQVVDARTGQPVVSAVVVGVWYKVGGFPGMSYHDLAGIREAETDAEGRFELERPEGRFTKDNEHITVYKAGYVAWNNLIVFPGRARSQGGEVPPQIALESLPTGEDRRRHGSFVRNAVGHYSKEETPRFWSAFREEDLESTR